MNEAMMIPVTETSQATAAAELAEFPVSKLKPFPKVGESLVILHEIKRDKRNEAVLGFQRNAKPIKTTIVAVYLDGSVRDNHSDVWEVKPGKLGQWETVNPEREAAIAEGRK